MHTSPNTSDLQDTRQADRLWAALMFFTRLPLWRIRQVDAACFRHVVDYWPLAGWLTGGLIALMFWVLSTVVPPLTAALLAVGTRLLLTGALHEDGLADCCDGFGGGTDRGRILSIMKDSRIGTYGVLGLLFHTALLVTLMAALPPAIAPAFIFTADVYAKACASLIILQLPYARTAEQAKSGVVYAAWDARALARHVGRCLLAVAPTALLLGYAAGPHLFWAYLVPPVVEILLAAFLKRRIGCYTGDCCGAAFLLCELGFYLATVALTFYVY